MSAIVFGSAESTQQLRVDKKAAELEAIARKIDEDFGCVSSADVPRRLRSTMRELVAAGTWHRWQSEDGSIYWQPCEAIRRRWREEQP